MVWITFGVPKPLSTHHNARYFMRSMSGPRRNSSGSIGGKFGLVNPMASSLGVQNNVVAQQPQSLDGLLPVTSDGRLADFPTAFFVPLIRVSRVEQRYRRGTAVTMGRDAQQFADDCVRNTTQPDRCRVLAHAQRCAA